MISIKQKQILAFSFTNFDALICDGAIRSGKTSIMTIAFVDWAMRCFSNTNFAICGKTVGSAIKNIITPYISTKWAKDKYDIKFTYADNKMTINKGNKTNIFYVYGGKDESSYTLIQGITLGGVLLDEVAIMTESFVKQALARCSINGSKYWFNCNPASPMHWFYKEWILKIKEKNAYYIHFALTDNPSLSEKIIERYHRDYIGVFYQRYIQGLWILAEGLVYGSIDTEVVFIDEAPDYGEHYISCDYGIINPFVAHLWAVIGNKAYCIDEYCYNYKEHGQRQKTDEEHYTQIKKLANNRNIQSIIIDPSASSMKETIRRHGEYDVRNAINDVLPGISVCNTLLHNDMIKINKKCTALKNEFALYSWNSEKGDEVIKENDHACDSMRYFAMTVLRREFSDIEWGSRGR